MSFSSKLMVIIASGALLGGVVFSPALALDTGIVLGESHLLPGDSSTELLSVCCPLGDRHGTIAYSLAKPQKVSIQVFDQQGSEVVQLVDQTRISGSHQTNWDGCGENGQVLSGGTYFLLMKTEESIFLRRMVLHR